ncbi:MAG: LbtU family siderophore porin [Bdellovibrionota bacterium]
MYPKIIYKVITLLCLVLISPLPNSIAEEPKSSDQVVFYRTPEERRDAGVKHFLTDWFSISGLLEIEHSAKRNSLTTEPGHSYENHTSENFQFDAELQPLNWLTGEFTYEYEIDTGKHFVDEALVAIEHKSFEIEFGKMELPFGEYYSYFITGPLIEFGETKDTALVLSYDYEEIVKFSGFIYEGRTKQLASRNESLDWGFAVESSPSEWTTFGISYISDLADSEEEFLSDFDYHHQRVPAISGFAVLDLDVFNLTFEYLSAQKSFQELDDPTNKPEAWNLEVARPLTEDVLLAARFESSHELENAPKLQTGLSLSWRATEQVLLSLDYLHGWHKQKYSTDDHGFEISNTNTLVAQISASF